jgi:hypothetical protein
MEIDEVSAKEYAEVIKPYHVFGTAAFNDMNRSKCDEVFYLLFKDGKCRLGIVGGRINNKFNSPFSAPFGGFSFISGDIRLQYIEEAIRMLKNWAVEKRLASICITLPPPVYEKRFISKQVNCLWRGGFEISKVDLNYSFDLESLNECYIDRIWHNARKNLRIALNARLQFNKCITDEEKGLAYDIIRKNREVNGYPLRMTWQQVSETIHLISSDFFIVYDQKHVPVASAIVFQVSQFVVQVVYWGDIQGYSELKPMNFIAFKLFEYYRTTGNAIVDIGPSTENSIPNYGLVEFKESIGCSTSTKFTLQASFT